MVKITVPNEFTALVLADQCLVRSGDDYYAAPPLTAGKSHLVQLRALRANGLFRPITQDEYQFALDAYATPM